MRLIIPPIKSQGIKTKLVPWIMDVVKIANQNGRWIEPFTGTGVVAFNSGFKQAILNDTNPHIINFYKAVQNGTITPALVKKYLEEANDKLSSADENGYVYFREVRDRFNKEFAPLDLLFLSRAGFNGMMRFGGKGNWNIPFCKKPNRFAQSYTTKIVNQVAKAQAVITDKWKLTNKNFSDIIPLATKHDIIYCDPPYFGRYVDYYNGWTEQDEELLFHLLSETKAKFILSTWHHNDWRANEMIEKFWNKFNIVTQDHFYHSGGNIENRRTVVEALVCNFDLDNINGHNHGLRAKPNVLQTELHLTD
ncbi:MAG TPA: Dam family site-specific DNA-(adenine-N6)-methyltransferase [Bacteroidia bacterium]|nr:Dam family site-specific DNA-(adenine-N6)-methyltransferase [Bacteroidia bacterium]